MIALFICYRDLLRVKIKANMRWLKIHCIIFLIACLDCILIIAYSHRAWGMIV